MKKLTKVILQFSIPVLLTSILSFSSVKKNEARIKWEESPEGQLFKKWEVSSEGKKVYASEAAIKKSIMNFSSMEGVVSSLSLPPGSRLGYGIMTKIDGKEFILVFDRDKQDNKIFKELLRLKINDKIKIKSRNVSHAPKYSYPIIKAETVEFNNKLIYKRPIQKGHC